MLTDVSRAIAVAVANALANEEIARLRDQLEAENVALRDQLSRITKFEEMVGDSPCFAERWKRSSRWPRPTRRC